MQVERAAERLRGAGPARNHKGKLETAVDFKKRPPILERVADLDAHAIKVRIAAEIETVFSFWV